MRRLLFITALLLAVACDDDGNIGDGDGDGGHNGEHLDGDIDGMRGDGAVLPDASVPDARPDGPAPDRALPDAAIPDAARPDAALPDASRPDAASPDAGPPGAYQLRLGRLHWTIGPAGRGPAALRFSGHGLKVEGRLRP